MSARICVGCQREDRALSTGTGEYFASSCEDFICAQRTRTKCTCLNFFVGTDAGKNALTHTTKDTSSVARRFIHTKLDVLVTQEEGATTKEDCCCLCRDARAGAALGEDEGDGLVKQRL